jgi:hypothetical protein
MGEPPEGHRPALEATHRAERRRAESQKAWRGLFLWLVLLRPPAAHGGHEMHSRYGDLRPGRLLAFFPFDGDARNRAPAFGALNDR